MGCALAGLFFQAASVVAVSVAAVTAVEVLDDVERQAMLLFVPPFSSLLASSPPSAASTGADRTPTLGTHTTDCCWFLVCIAFLVLDVSRCLVAFDARGASGSEPCCLPALPAPLLLPVRHLCVFICLFCLSMGLYIPAAP
jgi:hypothetical protein